MRTVVVGDVHGCAEELDRLLDRIAFSSGDRLVFVGDLIARGPDSLGVLDIARRTGAIVVRGNHEQKLLEWLDLEERSLAGEKIDRERTAIGKLHRAIGRALRPIDWTMLQTSCTSLDLPEHGLRVVHAGVDPAVSWERQATATLLRIRTVVAPERRRGERHVLWGTRYVGPPHVVFGHNAAPGLQLHPWATGLDTGCVYGGRLTALVLKPRQKVPRMLVARRQLLVSEPARKMWFAPTRAKRSVTDRNAS